MEVGTKYDDGKPRLAEMVIDFKKPLLELCKVWEFGANKYSKSNWKLVDNGKDRYTNAMLRHLLQEDDNPIDDESGLPHASHIAFNALARLYFILQEKRFKSVAMDESGIIHIEPGGTVSSEDNTTHLFNCNKELYLDKDIHTTYTGDIDITEYKKIDG